MSDPTLIIDDYTIVSTYDKATLIKEVKKLIDQGWVTNGPISVVSTDRMVQSMIKYPDVILKAYRDMLAELEDMQ